VLQASPHVTPRTSVVALVLLVGAVAAPSAVAARTLVIRLKSVTVSTTVNDVGAKGPSKGDVYSGRFRLLNVVAQFGRPAGRSVGTEESSLRLTSPSTGVVSGVVTLPGGTITYRGTGRVGSNAPIPVVRGTGAFAGARGTLIVGSGKSPLNTYRLTLP
jgi:hypothetical protein